MGCGGPECMWRYDLEGILVLTGACGPDGWAQELPRYPAVAKAYLLVAGYDERH